MNYIERYWRDATPEDAICEPPMLARFRNGQSYDWFIEPLMGIRRDSNYPWYSTNLGSHKECQVYDAPDPGDGWRLVDIESTTRLPSDERWYPSLSKWLSPDDCYCDRYQDGCFYRRRIEQPKPDPGEDWRLIDTKIESHECEKQHWHPGQKRWIDVGLSDEFYGDLIYRRRIEQPKPKYEPFRWEDREQLRGRWIGSNDGRWERFIAFIYNYSECFYANGISTESLLKEWHFLDTGEPVGRRVEQ